MPAPKGNQFWLARAKSGRDKILADPETMWKSACEYFEWIESNPLWESKVTQYQGDVVEMQIPRMRAMTIEGITLFMGISSTAWYEYAKRDDFKAIITRITEVMREQKFTGAASDQLNANIIARDLGLRDKQDITVKTKTAAEMSDEELIELAQRGK